jgi:hypothetical protein
MGRDIQAETMGSSFSEIGGRMMPENKSGFNEENIVEFVRNVLGCKCPDEVFDKIEHVHGDARTNIYTRSITIGDRLLIYVWETNDPLLVEAKLPAMLADGKNERDRRGLNRFRAVIATDDVDGIGPIAQRVHSNFSDKDDKVHLHIVHKHDV